VFIAEVEGVAAAEPLHEAGQIGAAGLDEEMVMIGHQHVGVKQHVVGGEVVAKLAQEAAAVVVAKEDLRSAVATRHDVVHGAGELEAWRSRH
jgi:hypothetical protein